MGTALAGRGVIVVDDAFKVVASNPEVLHILTFPERPDKIRELDSWLSNKVRSSLVDRSSASGLASQVQSARRTYLCRSFPLDSMNGHKSTATQSGKLLIVILERKGNQGVTIENLSERFRLTAREQQTVQFLMEGYTSKEIAQRMEISANTVKAFIRLVMVKMGVSTRSAIVGKVVCGARS
jgi:DNA-binding CsgD family transcriptional regulator